MRRGRALALFLSSSRRAVDVRFRSGASETRDRNGKSVDVTFVFVTFCHILFFVRC